MTWLKKKKGLKKFLIFPSPYPLHNKSPQLEITVYDFKLGCCAKFPVLSAYHPGPCHESGPPTDRRTSLDNQQSHGILIFHKHSFIRDYRMRINLLIGNLVSRYLAVSLAVGFEYNQFGTARQSQHTITGADNSTETAPPVRRRIGPGSLPREVASSSSGPSVSVSDASQSCPRGPVLQVQNFFPGAI